MLFCVDNSKTFCSNYSLPQDTKLLSLQMWANNMLPCCRRSLPKVPTKVKKKKKKKMNTSPQALLIIQTPRGIEQLRGSALYR